MSAEDWLSGTAIADSIGLSRNAVHKQVRRLIAQGYDIEAVPRRGYRLRTTPDRLDADTISACLLKKRQAHPSQSCHGPEKGQLMSAQSQTKASIASRICYEPRMDSTNARARRLALTGAPHGLLVVSDCQTSGRGRRGRPWFSPAGTGIYASLLLRPELPLESVPLIGLLAAAAAAEAVRESTGTETVIKWPNDLLLNGRKIAGILLEAASEPDALEYLVVGLGINVNTKANQLPERPLFPASSLYQETGRLWRRAPILAGWLIAFERLWPRPGPEPFAPLLQAWARLSATAGREIRIRMTPSREITGIEQGIDPDGALRVRTEDGNTQRVLSGDLRFGS